MRRGIGFDRLQYRRGSPCRNRDADFARFLQMAAGSAGEVEYHLRPARDLELLKTADWQPLSAEVAEVKRMLASLMKKLRADG